MWTRGSNKFQSFAYVACGWSQSHFDPSVPLSLLTNVAVPRESERTVPRDLQAFPIPLGGTFTFTKRGRGDKVFVCTLESKFKWWNVACTVKQRFCSRNLRPRSYLDSKVAFRRLHRPCIPPTEVRGILYIQINARRDTHEIYKKSRIRLWNIWILS